MAAARGASAEPLGGMSMTSAESTPPAGSASRIRIGIDVGGTFTDIVGMPVDGSPWTVRKVPSPPDNPSIAVLTAIGFLLEEEGDVEVDFLGHGTTAGTNAFLTK